ncbi:MAG: thioredoxin family protein [Geoalkalibacter sp.]|jgi:thioredoxin 1|uniref:thioredoxin family protein n=1 Tax=Geoalkalibacter sp. TaxID=3041440 RepID=UPI002A957EBB|nr:thioredoxin family protein [Thermodesulfobacteriota bacterium]
MMLTRSVWRLLVFFLLLPLGACSQTESSASAEPPAAGQVGSAEAQGLPRLVDLGADKCIPCKMMAPILDELEQEYAGCMEVQFIDVWKHRDRAAEYGVKMIPTQIFYDETDKELFRRSGFIGKEDILVKWRELGYDFKNCRN